MKFKKALIVLMMFPLSSCGSNVLNLNVHAFGTMNSMHLYDGSSQEDLDALENIISSLDQDTDNFEARGINNVYTINHTHEDVKVSENLYNLLKISDDLTTKLEYFNMYCGGLANLWKEALETSQIPDEISIKEQLDIMNSTHLEFKDECTVQRVGEGQIDLGAIAKGFASDLCVNYLKEKEIPNYILSFGYSSVALGDDTYYGAPLISVDFNKTDYYVELDKCFISTSGVDEQHIKIGDKTYSHIVNPLTGNATPIYDMVSVISDCGYLADALSTVFMMRNLEAISQMEQEFNVKAIVFSNGKVIYHHPGIEVLSKNK